MKGKALFAFILIICMITTLFTACGQNENDSDETTPTSKSGPSSEVENSADAGNGWHWDEVKEIVLWMPSGYSESDLDKVFDEINKITEAEIGVHVNVKWIPIADMATQFTLAIANKETTDIMVVAPTPAASFSTYYSTGIPMDISDLLSEYGQNILSILEEQNLLSAFTMADGGVYGLPNYRLMNQNLYLVFRSDILESTSVQNVAHSMTSWSDYEEVLAAIVDETGIFGVTGSGGGRGMMIEGYLYGNDKFSSIETYDFLGDGMALVYSDKSGNVSSVYEQEGLINTYKMFAEWVQKGYVHVDGMLGTEPPSVMMKSKVVGSVIIGSSYGIEGSYSSVVGTDITCFQIAASDITTSQVLQWGVVVPTTAKEPEAAVAFLNLLYTSEELMNLITWGIEGEHYFINENGEAEHPEGKDNTNCGYHSSDWVIGNQFLALPWTGTGITDYRAATLENMQSAGVSRYLGLSVDTSGYGTMVAALAAVKAEYIGQFTGGSYTDALYDEFTEKLQVAEIDDYVALYQAAVDDWLAG